MSTAVGIGEPPKPSDSEEPRPKLPRPGDVVAGRYRIERSLGSGGMGHVFVAEHTALQKRVALKMLSPGRLTEGEEQAARFLREARAGSRLSHPGIVEIHDFGTAESGLPFFAMELLEGEDLGERLSRRSYLPWTEARELVLEILEALTEAHAHGVIHRDLKPENCFIAKTGDGERLKLFDFGIAKLLTEPDASTLTQDGRILGTPHYMAPEQAIGQEVDGRADVYSCTAILYELLTGEPPFNDGSAMAILSKHLTQDPPSIRETAPALEIPRDLDAVILRGLAKEPEERFESAEQMADALRAVGTKRAGSTGWIPWALGAGVLAGVVALVMVATGSDDERPGSDRSAEANPAVSAGPTRTRPDSSASPSRGDQPRRTQSAGAEQDPPPTGEPEASTTGSDPAATAGAAASSGADPSSKPGPRTDKSSTSALPPMLERAVIRKRLRAALKACSKWTGPEGATLTVSLSISKSGEVSGATIAPPYAGEHRLGRCAARALNDAVLPPAQQGQPFAGQLKLAGSPND